MQDEHFTEKDTLLAKIRKYEERMQSDELRHDAEALKLRKTIEDLYIQIKDQNQRDAKTKKLLNAKEKEITKLKGIISNLAKNQFFSVSTLLLNLRFKILLPLLI